MQCKQATELISLAYEQSLSAQQQFRLKLHLVICPYCRAFRRNNHKLHQLIKQYCRQDHP
ncbi:hypothetical protein RO21_06365 [[Actinobacillus] muris]|uniref:Zf-HC2 domain-containing protein n=1 Tax=Muribacter muris TaxID=67855 RepID=A0A0J5P7G6_9PAST|nr:zf-HC2 domain-containing protein [Muribacter muris]KMK51424.1 hypothetical protein RO21_06365 [[Actinobacillus] muris] [Muribacter muris]MBF0784980.1 zf-HC2 domain-containing protein [Muribacter muris]MBF0827288.1 zf-HC2 domain-containing protein [Muribacter muris]TFV10897.1 zf-HC2 domain-containing protein [Muribacter muris]